MPTPTNGTVTRFVELVTDEQISALIQKYAMGQEIWWQRIYEGLVTQFIDPKTHQSVGQYEQPITKIYLGMRGQLLGKENYVWWLIKTDAIPDLKQLEEQIMQALESMRARKAAQGNGTSPFRRKS